jgi:hypothetical protein
MHISNHGLDKLTMLVVPEDVIPCIYALNTTHSGTVHCALWTDSMYSAVRCVMCGKIMGMTLYKQNGYNCSFTHTDLSSYHK